MLRFSIRSLMIGVAILVIPIAIITSVKHGVEHAWQEQEQLAKELRRFGATIEYQTRNEHVPFVVRPLCEHHVFSVVDQVDADSCPIPHSLLEKLPAFKKMRSLSLHGTVADDAILKRLSGHPQLQVLYLWRTRVSADGIARFQKANPSITVVEEELRRVGLYPL